MSEETKSSDFLDLVSYKQLAALPKSVGGNLIKANKIVYTGAQRIAVSFDDDDQPTVIAHSDGDVIVDVEFRCTCGRSTTVMLDYEHA